MEISSLLMIAAVALVCILVVRLLSKPIKFVFKILINAGFGFVILFIVNFFGDFVGLSLEINALSALVAGVLGVPGIVLLLVLEYFFL